MSNRLPAAAHTALPWRIHEIAPDFRIEDVWAFRTPGAGPDDFHVMREALAAKAGLSSNTGLTALVFAVRWKLGELFDWDEPEAGLAGRSESLCDRLPEDLRQEDAGQPVGDTPFTSVYRLHHESADELANKTMHTILHLGWVQGDNGDYELRMAALVKPNGLFGRLYMAGIAPFRYLIVYPAMKKQWERAWRNRPQANNRREEVAK
ncbi:DUF2867 domain-containing protein [Nocardia panacis]|uniref:DUF2867 domain-containing protein n=1 Tax=Nocardia panacis TaxID=2340916 RepID=A0A3A4KM51_9NOCA|nr:DUF2867 domain-containing protein [Nocardia panacis]RJO74104.1 DUF2867 domain-containing protein [Nocardia panacis]